MIIPLGDDNSDRRRVPFVTYLLIAANLVGKNLEEKQDIGFNSEYNALQVFWPEGQASLELARKDALARQLIHLIASRYQQKKQHEKNTA